MSWLRLYVTVEGQTEKEFADKALKPHLANLNIEVRPRVVVTNRQLGKRGGILNFPKLKGDLIRLMKEDSHPEARFTTMLDLYALPAECPGRTEARTKPDPLEKVATIEDALRRTFDDRRFHPYIRLHEFDALLYCDLGELQRRISGSADGIRALQREVRHLHPEEINEGKETAPSKRIIRHLPVYAKSKVRVGAPAATAIGLPRLRTKCPHFNQWLTTLERLT